MAAGSVFGSESWIDGQYLLWTIKKNPLPVPIFTSASDSDPLPGAIGQPHTRVLLGQSEIGMGWINGFLVGAGSSIGSCGSLEAGYFLLPTVSKKQSFTTSGEPGSPNFAVPIFDVTGVLGLNGIPGETIFILPGPLDSDPGFFGRFDLILASQFQGAELNGAIACFKKRSLEIAGLAGIRWLDLHESLYFKATSHSVPNFAFGSGFFNFSDRFITTNHFLGGQLGFRLQVLTDRWRLQGIAKGAIGADLQKIKIEGKSQTSGGNLFFMTAGTANQILPGGVFAEPSNRGTHRKTSFAGALEAKVQGGVRIGGHVEIELGYSFIWVSSFLRPGNQIDRNINSTRTALANASRATVGTGPGPIPFGMSAGAPVPRGPNKPGVPFKTASFYAQGLDAGLRFDF